jgi:hypothetical protein
VGARVNFVGFQNFVDDAHGQPSLAKPEKLEPTTYFVMAVVIIAVPLIGPSQPILEECNGPVSPVISVDKPQERYKDTCTPQVPAEASIRGLS